MSPTAPFSLSLEPVDPALAGCCPLAAVDIAAKVTGLVVEVSYTLRFVNTAAVPVAAVLKLPLPDDAVVRDVTLRQGTHTLQCVVRDVAAAREAFDAALARGQRAALAEEVRPNLLELRVSALAPDVPVELYARVASPLAFEAGEGTLVVPATMTPRYCPAGMTPEEARRVSAPFVRGERLYGLSFTLDLEAAGELVDVRSPSHALRVERLSATRARVALAEGEALPDRDVVITFRAATALDRPAVATARTREGDDATVMLALPPPGAAGEGEILAREVTFLLDRSGSMGGEPMEAAKRAVRGLLRALGPRDIVRVIAFDDRLLELPPRAVSDGAFAAFDRELTAIDARGGTEILPALERALAAAPAEGFVPVIVLLTDGAVGNEREVVARVARAAHERGVRAHAVGIGASVHREFVRGFARAGHGLAEFVTGAGDLEPALVHFQARSNAPLATGVSVTIEGLAARATAPSPAGDVDLGRPIVAFARVEGAGEAVAVLRARTAEGAIERRVAFTVPEGVHGNPAVESLWARARVTDLLIDAPEGDDEVRAIGLAYGIVTPRTALVAVERDDPGTGEAPRVVEVPLHLPAGMAVGAVAAAAPAMCAAPMEPTEYDVVLDGPGADRVATMRALRQATSVPLAEAKRMVTQAPVRVRELLYWEEASAVAEALKQAGAPVRVIVTGRPLTSAPARRPTFTGWYGGYAEPPPRERTDAERVAAALRFLGRAQSAEGGFGDAATTRRVLDAFAAAGETAARGPWRRSLARAEAFWWAAGEPAAPEGAHPRQALLDAQESGGADDGGVLGLGDAVDATAQLVLALASG